MSGAAVRTPEQRGVVCRRAAQRLLLLLQEEVSLVRGQAAEVPPHGPAESQLSDRVQTGPSEGQQLLVSPPLALCEEAESQVIV